MVGNGRLKLCTYREVALDSKPISYGRKFELIYHQIGLN